MMRLRQLWAPLLLAAALAGAGCARTGVASTPVGASTPPVELDDGRGSTALEAYPPALARAIAWNADARLYQVVVTRLMEKNLGLPSDMPGWFFMFRVPDSPVEYYVKIVKGAVSGVTEAQPIIIGEPPHKYLPIDFEALPIGSDQALRLYLDNGGRAYVEAHPPMLLDYRLVHVEGQPNPVWSIFDATDLTWPPLFNVDAVTSETVKDPYAP